MCQVGCENTVVVLRQREKELVLSWFLSCTCVLCVECRVSWVRVPLEAVLWKSDCLGCAVLLCLVVCLTLLASYFLPSSSLINMYTPLVPSRECSARVLSDMLSDLYSHVPKHDHRNLTGVYTNVLFYCTAAAKHVRSLAILLAWKKGSESP